MMKDFSVKAGPLIVVIAFLFMTSCGPNPRKSEQLLDEGIEYYYHAEYPEALNLFKNSIDADSENFAAWFWLGNYYENIADHKKAIDAYNKAINLNNNYADAYANRATAKKNSGNNKGACADWRKAAALGKHNLDNNLKWCERNGIKE